MKSAYWAYLRFHARDFFVGRGLAPLGFFVLFAGLPLWVMSRDDGGLSALRLAPMSLVVEQIYLSNLKLAITVGAFLLMSGLISSDRERQYYKFIFSKPLSVPRYYAGRALVFALCNVLLIGGIAALFSWIVIPVSIDAAMQAAGLYLLLLGGLGFLASTLTNRDGLVVVVIFALSSILQQVEPSGRLPAWAAQLSHLLPPAYAADGIRAALLAGREVDTGQLRLVLGYSAGMIVAGLIALRRLPIGR